MKRFILIIMSDLNGLFIQLDTTGGLQLQMNHIDRWKDHESICREFIICHILPHQLQKHKYCRILGGER